MPDGSATAHLYRPKLVTLAGENYTQESFRSDVAAALTVAIVALPLSMAIAVASGVTPERGLVGGFIVSALGGSRFQIGGPAGAFIVLASATVDRFGIEGLLLRVLLSGMFLTAAGFLRLGALIRYIPHAVTVGFTCGIALTIFASQLKEFAGIHVASNGLGSLAWGLTAFRDINSVSLAIGVATASVIFAIQRWRPGWPAMLIAVAAGTCAAAALHLPVGTVGSRFGDIPSHLPLPRFPNHSLSSILDVLAFGVFFYVAGWHRKPALTRFVPLAVLAGVLVVVSWNMIEKGLLALLRNWRSALVLGVTFGLTIVVNLTAGILAERLASILFGASEAAVTESASVDVGQ